MVQRTRTQASLLDRAAGSPPPVCHANSLPAAAARAVVVIGLKARACVRRDLVSFGTRARGLGHVGIPIMMAISKVFIVHDPKGLPQFGYAEFEEIAWP